MANLNAPIQWNAAISTLRTLATSIEPPPEPPDPKMITWERPEWTAVFDKLQAGRVMANEVRIDEELVPDASMLWNIAISTLRTLATAIEPPPEPPNPKGSTWEGLDRIEKWTALFDKLKEKAKESWG